MGQSPALLPYFLHFMKTSYLIVIDQKKVDAFNSEYFEEHPRAKKGLIKAPQHPSLNEYLGMSNIATSNLKNNWEAFIRDVLAEYQLIDKKVEKCRITYKTFFKFNRRHDLDNISPKFIFDGFVKAGFLVDDDYQHITALTTLCDIDKENPRIEILVEEI